MLLKDTEAEAGNGVKSNPVLHLKPRMDAGGHTEKSQVALAHLQSCVGSWIQNPPEHIQLLLLKFLLTVHHMHNAAATALAFGLQQSTTGSSIPLLGRRKGHLGSERRAVL